MDEFTPESGTQSGSDSNYSYQIEIPKENVRESGENIRRRNDSTKHLIAFHKLL